MIPFEKLQIVAELFGILYFCNEFKIRTTMLGSEEELQKYLKKYPKPLQYCKFYKGETDCPYNEDDVKSEYWLIERGSLCTCPSTFKDFKGIVKIFFERHCLNYEDYKKL